MIVRVEEKHIKKGKRKMLESCPVALAIKEAMNGVDVTVGTAILSVNSYDIPTPRSVSRFIRRFDNKKPVKSFNFKLEY